MNTIPSPQRESSGNEEISSERIQENINPFPHEMNITDGGEFLDDAIRMIEQPFDESRNTHLEHSK